jgi:hypothetical protein
MAHASASYGTIALYRHLVEIHQSGFDATAARVVLFALTVLGIAAALGRGAHELPQPAYRADVTGSERTQALHRRVHRTRRRRGDPLRTLGFGADTVVEL